MRLYLWAILLVTLAALPSGGRPAVAAGSGTVARESCRPAAICRADAAAALHAPSLSPRRAEVSAPEAVIGDAVPDTLRAALKPQGAGGGGSDRFDTDSRPASAAKPARAPGGDSVGAAPLRPLTPPQRRTPYSSSLPRPPP